MDLLTNIAGTAALVAVLLTLAAKFVPNERVYLCGYSVGKYLTKFGTTKIGYAWEKIEDFIDNSSTIFLNGFKDGLNSDDDPNSIIGLKKDDVSIKNNVRR